MANLSGGKSVTHGRVKDFARVIERGLFDLNSIWLFTFSDLKTIVGPMTVFGTINALSTLAFHFDQNVVPSDIDVVRRTPRVALWIWINLLPFAIDNQRQPAAMLEDSVNKPWRPMPSKRVHPEQAKVWMLSLYPLAIIASMYVGGIRQCLALALLGVWYNDLRGADAHCFVRNIINACGFVCYASGAMEVALAQPLPASTTLISWFAVIAAMVFTSVHSQDMADQEGDQLRGRKSVPLTIGDELSRWTIAVFVSAFSLFSPWFWGLALWAYLCPVILGAIVSLRSLVNRSVMDDKITFRLWNLWMVAIYCLPLVKRQSISLAA